MWKGSYERTRRGPAGCLSLNDRRKCYCLIHKKIWDNLNIIRQRSVYYCRSSFCPSDIIQRLWRRRNDMITTISHQSSYAIGWGALAFINAGLAQSKNRSGLAWFLISLLLGPIATFFIVILESIAKKWEMLVLKRLVLWEEIIWLRFKRSSSRSSPYSYPHQRDL